MIIMHNSHYFRQSIPNILFLLKEGNYPRKIAKKLAIPQGTLYRWMKKLEQAGMIKKEKRTSCNIYKINQSLHNLSHFTSGSSNTPYQYKNLLRLHNIAFKYPILRNCAIPFNKEVKLKSTSLYYWKLKGNTICKTNKNLIIHPKVLMGRNAHQLEQDARSEAEKLANFITTHYPELKLGAPTISRKPHHGIKDPVAQKIAPQMQISTDIAKIDASPPEDIGEIDWLNPTSADNYLKMPDRIADLEGKIDALLEITKGGITAQETFRQLASMIVNVQNQLLEVMKELKEVKNAGAKSNQT